MATVRDLEQAHDAGNTDRTAADDGIDKRERFSVPVEKAIRRRRGRRRFAPVVRDELVRSAVVHQQKRAAAQAGRLRLGQAEHELRCDRCVDGGASRSQHPVAGVDRQRIRGGDHEMPAFRRTLVGPAGRTLGREFLRESGGKPGARNDANDNRTSRAETCKQPGMI